MAYTLPESGSASRMAEGARRRGVIFDIDGTLVDDNYLHVIAWWQAFQRYGHEVRMVDIHHRVGMGSSHLVAELVGDADERVIKAHSHFYAPFRERFAPFPEARELLNDCADRGLAVVLATSADPEEVESLKTVLDADDFVAAITGADDAEEAKPAPDIINAALDKAGLRAED